MPKKTFDPVTLGVGTSRFHHGIKQGNLRGVFIFNFKQQCGDSKLCNCFRALQNITNSSSIEELAINKNLIHD